VALHRPEQNAGDEEEEARLALLRRHEEDLPAIHARLEKLARRAAAPTTREANAIFYEGPHGVVLEVRATPKRTIDQPDVPVHRPRQDARGAPLRSRSWKVQPTRLSHALVFSPDIAETVAFYTEALGLRVSDDSPGIVFLHAPHGSDHHVIAFARGPSAGLHHVSWSVPSFDIDHIPASVDWPASTQSPEDGFYLWGPDVPPDFITNYEAADASPSS
jgi:catechol 2,3-dioxygenase-like lactoylglutathione lyase family enzyme